MFRTQRAAGKISFKAGVSWLDLNARVDAVVQGYTYTFATPVLGGQASVSVLGALGNAGIGVDATLTGPARQYDLRQQKRYGAQP